MNLNFKTLVGALAVLSIASCSKNDVFDAEQAAANEIAQKKSTFENNFVAKYGQVAPTQSWDFSTNQQRLGTRGEGDQIVTTIVDGLDFGKISYPSIGYNKWGIKGTKNNALLSAITEVLPEGKKHQGETVTLVAPSNSFTIYPLTCQGAWTHDLMVKVGNSKPVTVYQKDWTDFSVPYANGTTFTNGSKVKMRGLYVEAPIGTPIEIYLDNICEWSQDIFWQWHSSRKQAAGTSNGQAIYVEVGNDVKPDGVTLVEGAIVKYIGIEDDPNGDKDYNDVVLAVVGNPAVPEEIKIENEEYKVPVSVTKRYMMEDLGSTDDFDFNDVVVDVTETTVYTHKVTIVNGVKESDVILADKTTKSQKAVVRHLGGIYPFVLTIGNTTIELGGKESFDTDVEIEKDVTGWIPAQNNVSVKVKESESKMYTNEFPKEGKFPMMFACDPEVKWAAERQKFDFEKEFGVSFTK